MVLKLSLNAQKSFDDYLNQVKACLKGVKSVDSDEIQQHITEHIENELADSTEPVGSESLDEVLKKLGSPQQWVPEDELSWWKNSPCVSARDRKIGVSHTSPSAYCYSAFCSRRSSFY